MIVMACLSMMVMQTTFINRPTSAHSEQGLFENGEEAAKYSDDGLRRRVC